MNIQWGNKKKKKSWLTIYLNFSIFFTRTGKKKDSSILASTRHHATSEAAAQSGRKCAAPVKSILANAHTHTREFRKRANSAQGRGPFSR